MSIHLGVCHGPIDAVTGIYIGEREAWTGDVTTQQGVYVDKQELFGGLRKEGGVSGQAYYLPGNPTQLLPENLCNRLGLTQATCPGYRGIASLFFVGDLTSRKGFYWSANQPSLKGIWARVRRMSTTLSSTNSQIGPDANPAHIIYECLTNRVWGMGADPSAIDVIAFTSAGLTLFNESFGLSLMWAQQASIEDFVREILDHIQATLFPDPRTGLLTIKLIRDDYDINTLPIYNADNCTVDSYQKKSWSETTNEIVATWTNPVNEQEETVSLQDLANFSIQGALVSDSRNYYGVRNADLAIKLCARDLRVASSALASVDISADRSGWSLVPGDVFELIYPEYNIASMIIRITSINYGADGSPTVRITGVEDVFSLPITQYISPPTTSWIDPSEDPAPMAYSNLFTLPYFFVSSILSSGDLANFNYPEAFVAIAAAQTGSDTFSFDLLGQEFDNLGNPITSVLGRLNCVGRALLSNNLARQNVSVITSFTDFRGTVFPAENVFMLIVGTTEKVSELTLITNVSGPNYTVNRGALDTIPRAWPSGTQVFFFEKNANIIDSTILSAFETVSYKLLSVTSKGILSETLAPLQSVVVSERAHLPLRPANCAVQGLKYTSVTVPPATALSLTWANRNRVSENAIVLSWEAGNVTPEVGQLTRVKLINLPSTVIYQADFTGIAASIPASAFVGYTSFIARFSSVNAGLESLQFYDISVNIV